MKLQDLQKLSVGIISQQALLTIGTGNKISLSTRIAKETLLYQEGDVLYIDKLVRDGESWDVIACIPAEIVGIKTFTFNKGTLAFGDKTLADILGGAGSEWEIEGQFDELELDGNRVAPLYSIVQKVNGKKKQKEAEVRYEEATKVVKQPTEKKEEKVMQLVNQDDEVVTPPMTEAQVREQEFESEAPELETGFSGLSL